MLPTPKLRTLLVCTIALLLLTATAHAQNTINVPKDQPTIQAGINAANTGDTVLVAPGTYYEQLNFDSKAITLLSSSGAIETIIDGSNTGTVVFMGSASSSQLAILDGFTIQHGYPNAVGGKYDYNYGSAVDVDGNAIVRNNVIAHNSTCGVDILNGNVTVRDNHIFSNFGAKTAGGNCRVNGDGILAHDNSLLNTSINLLNNLIEENEEDGIALSNVGTGTTVNIKQNVIRANGLTQTFFATGYGVAVGDFTLVNVVGNLITGNEGPGIIEFTSNSMNLVNNTIDLNSVTYTPQYHDQGTEIQLGYVDTPATLSNNIIVGNQSSFPVISCSSDPNSSQTIGWDHNVVYDTSTKTGSISCFPDPTGLNLYVDPQLKNPAGGDYHLAASSRAIDAGSNSAVPLTSTDLDGNPRIQDATGTPCAIIDIGAFEYPGTATNCADASEMVTSSLNPSTYAQSVTFKATVSGTTTPTGSITFTDSATTLSTMPLDASGNASFTTSSLTANNPGTTSYHLITATYNPTGSFAASSASLQQVVNGLPTTNTLAVSPTSGTTATTYTLKATLTSASSASSVLPTGTVVFYISPVTGEPGLQIGSATLANGAATITSSTLPVSSGYVYELYSGDTLYANSTSNAVNLNITGSPTTATTLAITAAGAPVTTVPPGTVVTLTATTLAGTSPVSPGQVNFCDATASLCSDIHLIGTAQLTSAGTAVLRFIPGPGTHSYKAVFVGTQTNSTSASPAQPLTVGSASSNATTTLLSATGAPGDYTLTATVTGSLHTTPTGTISFLDTGNDNYVLASAALSSPGSGLHFTELPINPTGDLPSNVVTADFNGDGILDFAVAAFNSLGISVPGSLSIFLGKGDGTFSAGPVLVTDVSPQTLVVADFNADGKADLAYSTLDSGNITVLLGNGDGSFTQAPNPIQGTFADVYGLVAGDFNGDGNEDLVYDDAQTRKVVVLLGNGDGTFAQVGAQSATGDNPIFIVAGDFNRDGKLDLAVDNVSPADGSLTASNLTILLGNGDGTFTSAPSVPVGVGPEGLVTADFNGDGKLDLAVANIQPPATVMVFSGNGDGTFSGPVSTIPIAYLNALSVGDVNGDGIPDIATSEEVGSTAPQNATILVGKGDGSFTIAYAGDGSIAPVGVTAADFNGDGLADLAVPAEYGGVEVFLSTLGSSATATVTHISPVGTGQHLVDASFPGDSTYAGSLSNPVSLTAQRVPTTLTLTTAVATSGSPITLTAALSPNLAQNHSATGLVTFSSNGNTLGTASVANGVATLAVPSLPAGLDALQAQYPGDTNFAPSSGTGSITVGQSTPDFTLAGPSSITFRTQSAGSATLTLTSLNSFTGPVALTCNLPQPTTYTCALSPATPSLAANGTAASALAIHPVLSAATSPANPSRIFLATLCPLALLLFARRRRHRLAPLLTLALLAILTSALTACGSDVYTVATRPGTYPLTVTATGTASGTPTPTTHTLALNVVITP